MAPDSAPSSVAADPLAPLAALEGVPQAVASASAAVDAVLNHRPRVRAQETAQALLRAAWASAVLDGAQVEFEDLRGVDTLDPLGQGAVRVSTELMSLIPVMRRAPHQALARLHALASVGVLQQDAVGVPRAPGAPVPADPLSLGPPPLAQQARERLQVLGRTMQRSAAPAVVVAAVVHGELLALRPFAGANGVVARAASRLVLAAWGFDPVAVTVPEVVHLRTRTSYVAAMHGYLRGTPAGLATWIRQCADALVAGAGTALEA